MARTVHSLGFSMYQVYIGAGDGICSINRFLKFGHSKTKRGVAWRCKFEGNELKERSIPATKQEETQLPYIKLVAKTS